MNSKSYLSAFRLEKIMLIDFRNFIEDISLETFQKICN